MSDVGGKRLDWGNLRRLAEQRLRERKEAANQALRDPERLVHELEVHQAELEIQNEELRESRLELGSALARYTEICEGRESCTLELLQASGRTVAVQLMATLLARAEPLLLLTVQEVAPQEAVRAQPAPRD